jgi:hypothetical protein
MFNFHASQPAAFAVNDAYSTAAELLMGFDMDDATPPPALVAFADACLRVLIDNAPYLSVFPDGVDAAARAVGIAVNLYAA